MKIGKVTGAVWATRKAQCLMGQTFLVVECDGQHIVAADQVGAGPGTRCCWLPEPLPANTAWMPRWMRLLWPL